MRALERSWTRFFSAAGRENGGRESLALASERLERVRRTDADDGSGTTDDGKGEGGGVRMARAFVDAWVDAARRFQI